MKQRARVCILGAGSMGASILEGLIRSRDFYPEDLIVIGRDSQKLAQTSDKYGIGAFHAGSTLPDSPEAIILCCKPGDLATVSAQLRPILRTTTLVISALAGTSINALKTELSHECVVRAIPNIAASMGASVTLWVASSNMQPHQIALVKRLIGAIGDSIEVEDEKYVELATPLSGAAPALVALFIESLIDSSVHIGLPRSMATSLVVQSVLRSMQLIKADNGTAADVRTRVTSPGGLTSECIATLEQHGVRTAVLQAILAGLNKTQSLGSQRE